MEWFPIGENAVFTFDQPNTRHGEGYHMNRILECNSLNILNPCLGQPAELVQHGLLYKKENPSWSVRWCGPRKGVCSLWLSQNCRGIWSMTAEPLW